MNLSDWISPKYLRPDVRSRIKNDIKLKPFVKYAVLDDFLCEDALDAIIDHHKTISFSDADRVVPGGTLPYDASVKWADDSDYGYQFLASPDWRFYCIDLLGISIVQHRTEIKLRKHRPQANGFWIHTDGGNNHNRRAVAMLYFNKDWTSADGGLLQLWAVDGFNAPGVQPAPAISAADRLSLLESAKRIHGGNYGGGCPDGRPCDLVLIDQIMPIYNRLVLIEFISSPAYHSVTPSHGRERENLIQWFY